APLGSTRAARRLRASGVAQPASELARLEAGFLELSAHSASLLDDTRASHNATREPRDSPQQPVAANFQRVGQSGANCEPSTAPTLARAKSSLVFLFAGSEIQDSGRIACEQVLDEQIEEHGPRRVLREAEIVSSLPAVVDTAPLKTDPERAR